METHEIKRWEIVESRGRRYLRDRHINEGILIEIHESQVVTEDDYFITIYCSVYDDNFVKYSSLTKFNYEAEMYVYMFKKKGEDECYTSFL